MKLITLAKNLDLNTETEYFDYCINSYANGNFAQCRKLFADMNGEDRKRLVEYIAGCYDNPQSKDVYKFYWNLL